LVSEIARSSHFTSSRVLSAVSNGVQVSVFAGVSQTSVSPSKYLGIFFQCFTHSKALAQVFPGFPHAGVPVSGIVSMILPENTDIPGPSQIPSAVLAS
jgi:hypothetical protein